MGMTLSPMVGLGSNGGGVGAMSGIPPQLLMAMLQSRMGGMGGAGAAGPMVPGMAAAGGGANPLSGLMQRAPMAGGMMPPSIPPGAVQPPQQPQGIGPMLQQLGGAAGGQGGGLLAMLKGGQTGVAPAPMPGAMQQPAPLSSANPNLAWNPLNPVGTSSLGGATANQGMLANLLHGLFGGAGG